MSINFSIKSFAYPLEILRLRTFLEKSQWFSKDQLEEYQFNRLKTILNHSYKNIPYYNSLFEKIGFYPKDFRRLSDLLKIPVLTKDMVRENFDSLVSRNCKKFIPALNKTTGTSGKPLEFYLDKYSNILEFSYYWRYWSWAGYKLGMPFADFTLAFFLRKGLKDVASYSPITRRLCLNPAQLSCENIKLFITTMEKHKTIFIKGTPSTIYAFADLSDGKNLNGLSIKAIFTSGELLLPHQREKIEKIFRCKVLDSYGHMERTVGISQCLSGTYHINSEYGVLEVEENKALSSSNTLAGEIIGTSLHNYTMPLIRYKTEDIIELDVVSSGCSCGRGLPICKKITGRSQDIIVTPDGRFITNIFILFSILKGALWAQIVQESAGVLKVKIIKGLSYSNDKEKEFLHHLKEVVGDEMSVEVEYTAIEMLKEFTTHKYRPVISYRASPQ